MLDRALLLLPLGHADLTLPKSPLVPLTECYAVSPLLSRLLSVTVINALLCTAKSSCLSVLAPCWGGGCTPYFSKGKSLFNISKTFVVTLKNVLVVYFSQRHSDEMYIYQLKFS